jgi:aryl-alcohol dehydrogenase-like predicted oxidoreductase
MEQRRLGRSGRTASIVTLGTSRLATLGQQAAITLIREAIDHGVNVIETGWAYGDGKVERWLGLALKDGYRDKVMLVLSLIHI